jgi:HEAT repeat protein
MFDNRPHPSARNRRQMPSTVDDPVPDLVRALTGRTPTANRVAALHALGRLGEKALAARTWLIAAAFDDDAKVRIAATQALGQIGPDAAPALARLLVHSDKYVRRNATWGLGKLGVRAKPVLRDLCRALKDADPRTAAGAAQALGAMGVDGADAVPDLAEAMRGTNVVLCRLAAKALSEIGPPAKSELIAHLSHHDPFIRGEAAVALGWMGPAAADAVPQLTVVLTTLPKANAPPPVPPPKGDGTGDPASPDDNARTFAAQALGRIGPAAADALAALALALHDPHPSVGAAAKLAIKQIRG